MRWQTAARAADLIALDLRIDQWCSEVGRVSASGHELREVIRKTEEAATRVGDSWAAYLAAPELDTKDVQDAVEDACQAFLAVLTEVDRGSAK